MELAADNQTAAVMITTVPCKMLHIANDNESNKQ